MITSQDIATLARSICESLSDEVRMRCAIGRAYYSVYHQCLVAANSWCGGLAPGEASNTGVHERLFIQLKEHSKIRELDAPLRILAEDAKKLRNLRVQADYELTTTMGDRDLRRSLWYLGQVEKKFIEMAEKVKGPGRS